MPTLQIAPVEIDGKSYEVERATIVDTMLGVEDHGMLTTMVTLNYTGSGQTGSMQGAGGYALDAYDRQTKSRNGTLGAAILIRKTLEVAGVQEWEELRGKQVYALRDGGWGGTVRGLMNTMDPDIYVIFKDCFKDDE